MAKDNTGNPGFGEVAIREYLETWLHGQMRPLAIWLVTNHPGLANDKILTVVVPWLIPLAEAAIRTRFGRTIEKSRLSKMIFEIGTDLTRELISEIEEVMKNPPQDTGKKDQSKTEVIVFPTIWTSIANPEIGFVDGCSAKHQFEMKPVTKKRKGAPDEQGEEPVARDGFFPIEFADFIDGGGRAPLTPAEGWKNGCCCKARIVEAKAKLLAQRDAKAKAEAPKPKSEPLVTRDELRTAGKWALGKVGAAATAVGNAASAAGHGIATAATAGAKAVQKLPGQIEQLGTDMRTADKTRAAQMKLARQQRQQARGQ